MMSIQSRGELVAATAARYKAAARPQKGRILDEFVAGTGYHRKYAIALLRRPLSRRPAPRERVRKRQYGSGVQQALERLWKAANCICSKRLIPFLPELIAVLERCCELRLEPATRELLLKISPATADRLLKKARRQPVKRGLGTTKPGTLLKRQIAVRTAADWDEKKPGFIEADLVAHCGETTRGEYLNSLVLTDIETGWTLCMALLNRSERAVTGAIAKAQAILPFPLLGLDTDNGSEFINYPLKRFCEKEGIKFTRCRPYKKNDQCHVEQKNFSIVRQTVGYERHEGKEEYQVLTALHQTLGLYVNFFQPSTKLIGKKRDGAKVIKQYDKAQTPHKRIQDSVFVSEKAKAHLTEKYHTLNPVALLKQIETLQDELWDLTRVRIRSEATKHAE